MAKKKKNQSARALGGLVVGATGSSLLYSAMPSGTGAALGSAAAGFSSFVGVGATAYGAGLAMKQLKHFPKVKRRKLKGGIYK